MKTSSISIFVTLLTYAFGIQNQVSGSLVANDLFARVPAAKSSTSTPTKIITPAQASSTPSNNNSSSSIPWIPVSTQQNTGPGSLDFYYLLWNTSYSVGDKLSVFIIINPNNKPPPQVSLSLYDEFNKIKLTDISNASIITTTATGTPFPVYSWTVASSLSSKYDFKTGYFTLQMTYNEGNNMVTKDRRIKLNNVVANPGGAPNPVYVPSPKNNNSNNSSSASTGDNSNTDNKVKSVAASNLSTVSLTSIGAFVILQLIAAAFT